MQVRQQVYPIRLFALIMLILAGPLGAQDEHWSDAFAFSDGTNIEAMATAPNGDIYVGGDFTYIGGTPVSNIARWDGASWTSVGQGTDGSIPDIHAMAFDPAGNLYIAGEFTTVFQSDSTALSAAHVAMWDVTNQTWSNLSTGTNSAVLAMAIDDSGSVYVGGGFSTVGGTSISNMAMWDGSSWSAVIGNSSGPGGWVYSMASQGMNIYIGGSFASVDGFSTMQKIARWDGAAWSPLGQGITTGGIVWSIGVDDTTGGAVYLGLGGNSTAKNTDGTTVSVLNIVKWDGNSWSAMGGGVNEKVEAFLAVGGDSVYVAGNMTAATDTSAQSVDSPYLLLWDGGDWSAVDIGLNRKAYALTQGASGTLFYVGGDFTATADDSQVLSSVATWDGQNWGNPGGGINNLGLSSYVYSLAIHGTDLYAGGAFIMAGGHTDASNVARLNGGQWFPLGQGITSSTPIIYALTPTGTDIYIGGYNLTEVYSGDGTRVDGSGVFKYASGTDAWTALGQWGEFGLTVTAVEIASNGDIYVGGLFTEAASITYADRIVKWDASGSTWEALGGGANGSVQDIAIDDSGNVYIVGGFTAVLDASGNTVTGTARIAKWDGASWSALGSGLNADAKTVATDGMDVYVGGGFSQASDGSGTAISGTVSLARWDGAAWYPVGQGFNVGQTVQSIVAEDGVLYVGGVLYNAVDSDGSSVTVSHIAFWDGHAWASIGTGVDNSVVVVEKQGNDLYLGGDFLTAGGISSSHIAHWSNNPPQRVAEIGDVSYLQDSGAHTVVNDVSFYFSDPIDNDALSFYAVSLDTANLSVDVDENDALTVTPATDFFGDVEVVVVAVDVSDVVRDTLLVTIRTTNSAPVAVADAATTDEDQALDISVVANDSDADGDPLTISSVTQPIDGATAINFADTTVTYTPDSNFNGEDSFTYVVSDGNGGLDTETVTVTVTPVNDRPVATDDVAATAEDTAVVIPVVANDNDAADGDPLTILSVTDPANGATAINSADTTVTYTPDSNFNGEDSFTYVLSDGNGGLDTATVTVTVAPVNDPPVATDDVAATPEDTPVTITALLNDSDVEGDLLDLLSVSPPQSGTAAINFADTTVTYTPNLNFYGEDSFTYVVSDGNGGEGTASITVTVSPVNDAPVALDDYAATASNQSVTIPVLSNDSDVDQDGLVILQIIVAAGAGVAVADPGDTTITYTPGQSWMPTDTLTYEVSDGQGGLDTATVTVFVTDVAIPIIALDDTVTTAEDVSVIIDVRENDLDADGDPLVVTSVSNPAHGQATVNADSTVTYTPDPDFFGPDSFLYVVTDNQEGQGAATVYVEVTPVADRPTAVDDAATTPEEVAVTIPVLNNDFDVDGDSLVVITVSDPAHGQAAVNADSTMVIYTPDPDFSGADSFSYTIGDGNDSTATGTVSVTVLSRNDGPETFFLLEPADGTTDTTRTPTLSWSPAVDPDPEDTVRYTVHLTMDGETAPVIFPADTATFYQLVDSLTDNASYHWKVVAMDLSGVTRENDGGLHRFVVNRGNDAPAKAALITPTPNSIETDLTPLFYWTPAHDPDPGDSVSYHLSYWGDAVVGVDSTLRDTTAMVPLEPLADNSAFYWMIRAYDLQGAYSVSDTVLFWTDAFPDPPQPFITLFPPSDTVGLATTVEFKWRAAEDPDPLDHVEYTLVYATNWADSSTYQWLGGITDTVAVLELPDNTEYYWLVEAVDQDTLLTYSNEGDPVRFIVGSTLNIDGDDGIPVAFALHPNYPNPFNPTTLVRFDLPQASNVVLVVYDLLGREVLRLKDERMEPGYHQVVWNGRDRRGRPVPTGMYIVLMTTPQYTKSIKMVLLK